MIIKPENPDELIDFLTAKPLILYGMGDTGRRIAKWCVNHRINFMISDKKASELKSTLGADKIILPHTIARDYPEANIVISSIVYVREITDDLVRLGVNPTKIFQPFMFMPDHVTIIDLEDNGLVNWERMNKRCRMVADWGWIPDSVQSVVDYSAGEGLLIKKFLPENTAYYPIDYKNRGENTTVCDFSKREFPDIYAELSFCFNMAMYTRAAEELIDSICKHSGKRCIFTAITIEGMPDIEIRRYSGMVSDLSEKQIVYRFSVNGFQLNDIRYHTAGNSTMTFFLFERRGESNKIKPQVRG